MKKFRTKEPLAQAFNQAIIAHFRDEKRCDASDIAVAACAIMGAYIRAVNNPIKREELLEKTIAMLREHVSGVHAVKQ